MNEEQTVLDFFSQEENFPLALIAAEHIDAIRIQYNNRFWDLLKIRLDAFLTQESLPWRSELTEDRGSDGTLVGLHLEPLVVQRTYLLPFMEQQLMGNSYRIYHGLMWNSTPEPSQKDLSAIGALLARTGAIGFKDSDSFLAWQWSSWYPRRKDFLLRLFAKQDDLLEDAMKPWQALLQSFGEDLRLANVSLSEAPRSAAISLDKLHHKIR